MDDKNGWTENLLVEVEGWSYNEGEYCTKSGVGSYEIKFCVGFAYTYFGEWSCILFSEGDGESGRR